MTESALQKKCLRWLKENHPDIIAVNVHGGGWSAKGFPDIICCIHGTFATFELKVGDNDMQPDQRVWKKRIVNAGGRHFCPRSLEEFKKNVEEVINESYLTLF